MDEGDFYSEHKSVSDHDLIFEFFQEAMSGIVLVYAALNNFANEHIPNNFSMEVKGKLEGRDYFIEKSGIELRLSRVLHIATTKPNLMTTRPDMWEQILRLKVLRDNIEHANGGIEALKTDIDVDKTVLALLINEAKLPEFAAVVKAIIDEYRDDEYGPQNVGDGEHIVKLVGAKIFADNVHK
jgi:hypothetical protein